MQLTMDPAKLRGLIALRRAATDMKLPMSGRLKIHFITRRAELLSNFSITAGAWMMLLHLCEAEGRDGAELDAAKKEVVAFKEWAEAGLQELQRIGLHEAVAHNEARMPDDPKLVASMRKMLGLPPRPDRDPGGA